MNRHEFASRRDRPPSPTLSAKRNIRLPDEDHPVGSLAAEDVDGDQAAEVIALTNRSRMVVLMDG